MLLTPYLMIVHRARALATSQVPEGGPAIIAPNHFSFLDHFFIGVYLRRKIHFMAKSQLFKRPMQFVYTHGGVFPVRRGHDDQEAFITAEAILARGGCVVMYCEGGRSRTGELAERPKPGIGRLALNSGASVVPVAIHGSQRVRNWKRLNFPRVTVHYGEPLVFTDGSGTTRERQQEVADEIFAEIKRLYAALDDPQARLRKESGRGALRSLLRGG
jgi:1-acyl-sn-glycerol-3-phosphate acyltransferase